MKKIINGLLYNTNTAHLVGSVDNDDCNTNTYITNALYRKKTGEYFAFTRLISHLAKNHDITPLSFDSAKQWAEDFLTPDDYLAEFDAPEIKDTNKITLNLTVTPQTKAILEQMRATTGKSISAIINDLVLAHQN